MPESTCMPLFEALLGHPLQPFPTLNPSLYQFCLYTLPLSCDTQEIFTWRKRKQRLHLLTILWFAVYLWAKLVFCMGVGVCPVYNVGLSVAHYVAQCHVRWTCKMNNFKIIGDKKNLRALLLAARIAGAIIRRAQPHESQLAAPTVFTMEKHGITEYQ